MHVKFEINHQVQFGESILIAGSLSELGNGNIEKAVEMTCAAPDLWSLSIDTTSEDFSYFYLVKNNEGRVLREFGEARHLQTKQLDQLLVQDYWRSQPKQEFLYTSAFTESFFGHPIQKPRGRVYKNALQLLVNCPYVTPNQTLVLCGESDYLGNWDAASALAFSYLGNAQWSLDLSVAKIAKPLWYKLAIVDTADKQIVHWEERDNRLLIPAFIDSKDTNRQVVALHYAHGDTHWKAAGVAIPIFSLRSEKSAGVGDFGDIQLMVDWAAKTGQKIIQILPVNDTTTTYTWTDSYPYSAISIYALHPQYFAYSQYQLQNKAQQKAFDATAKKLNAGDTVDYEAVMQFKLQYIAALYQETAKAVLSSKAYKDFYQTNEHWLFPYACFSVLRDKYKTAHFPDWKQFKTYHKKKLQSWIETDNKVAESIHLVYFTQFLLHQQLLDASAYAKVKSVILKGDIPIGISRDSVESWTEPHLFNMDVQTGAPPDDFSVNGQNWGFPTYNWHNIAQDGFKWWINRFRKMADYFDAYRIDHILGFFRIWEIPLHSVQGLLGYFSPALPFSVQEINNFGLHFDANAMTKAFIHEQDLQDIFGDKKDEIIAKYLNRIDYERFELREFCNTQQKIKAIFAEAKDEESKNLRDGLYAICNEVLFIQDKYDTQKFHPRISGQHSFAFKHLQEHEKHAYNNLYDHFFYHRHNEFWYAEAMKKLPVLIASTKMLVCGEDLGMIPACVPQAMQDLKILSLEIQRMPKTYQVLFENLERIPYMSVCTTSTHDMSPMRLWWEENTANTQAYYHKELWRSGEAPASCSAELCEAILQKHLHAPAMLAIIPWQDWMAVDERLRRANSADERINIPAIVNHYWNYRMHMHLEDLLLENELNERLTAIIKHAGR